MKKNSILNRIGAFLLGAAMCAALTACSASNEQPKEAEVPKEEPPQEVTQTEQPAPEAIKKAPGGDVENAVFYIAVKDAPESEVKYYYYTKEELEALETQQEYYYNDHSVDKTVTCKGALLGTLIEGLDGVNITDELIVQYAEEDGYHADAATEVLNSDYKDTVASLTNPILAGDGSTKNPRRPIVTYLIHEEYDKPDEFNVNDGEGVFKDADDNSGFLRIYRDTGVANHTVLKYIIGVVISPDGSLLSGEDGCTIVSVTDKDTAVKVEKDHKIKGLLPGMQFAVKAQEVETAELAEGEKNIQVVTAGTGLETSVTFKYTEKPYLNVVNGEQTTTYTFTQMQKMGTQVPSVEGNTAPYGYVRPMYYRYNGSFLSDILVEIPTEGKVIRLVGADGTSVEVKPEELGKYFVAYCETFSKSSTNIPEGKRKTKNYPIAQVLLPESAENITGSAEDDYTEKGSPVTVAFKDVVSIEVVGA